MPVKFLATPFGRYTKPSRRTGFAAVCASADSAGTIASSSGSPNVAPTPRRNVRLGKAIFVMNIRSIPPGSLKASGYRCCRCAHPHSKRRALDDAGQQRGEAIVVLRRVADDGAHRGRVVILEAAPESVGEHLLGERRHEPGR